MGLIIGVSLANDICNGGYTTDLPADSQGTGIAIYNLVNCGGWAHQCNPIQINASKPSIHIIWQGLNMGILTDSKQDSKQKDMGYFFRIK